MSGARPSPEPATPTADTLLLDVARAVLDRCGGQRWAFQPGDAWCFVRPPATVRRAHGWKLHVSATPLAAPGR
ncbi:hypothetical protein [Streptomyces sp. NPDC051704]|uniref:class III lanthionine synthetase LanKC N-terminal domain-containing protein n=1 Tax=Streptomyces sp. NPDC051704 TaxID=3365671 RepID=UPI0037BAD369